MTPSPRRGALETRYATEPAFRAIVDAIAAYLRAELATILDAHAAAELAAWHVAQAYLDTHPAPPEPPPRPRR